MIGGFTVEAGGCTTGTVTIAGVTQAMMSVDVAPLTYPGDGITFQGYVSAPNVVTVKVCSMIAGYIPASQYNVNVLTGNGGTPSGAVTSVTATSPIASTGTSTPNISYNGGTLQLTAGNALQYTASGWQLLAGRTASTAAFQTSAADAETDLVLAPSGVGTIALFGLYNSSDLTRTNTGILQFSVNGATAALQTRALGTGTTITALNLGEVAGNSALLAINFTFGGTTKISFSSGGTLSFPQVSGGLQFKGGSNARVGTGTLAGGTATIANTSVTANSYILVQDQGGGVTANIGALFVASQTAGTGFTVQSSNALDTSNFKYLIFETN